MQNWNGIKIVLCLFELTLCLETPSLSKSFNLSTLHCILTSCPTLRPSEGRGRKPTARQGSSTGLCKVIALLKINSCLASSTPIDSFMTGGWAPIVLLPEIPYLIFNMLSGCFLASVFCFEKSNQLINCINQAIIIFTSTLTGTNYKNR